MSQAQQIGEGESGSLRPSGAYKLERSFRLLSLALTVMLFGLACLVFVMGLTQQRACGAISSHLSWDLDWSGLWYPFWHSSWLKDTEQRTGLALQNIRWIVYGSPLWALKVWSVCLCSQDRSEGWAEDSLGTDGRIYH